VRTTQRRWREALNDGGPLRHPAGPRTYPVALDQSISRTSSRPSASASASLCVGHVTCRASTVCAATRLRLTRKRDVQSLNEPAGIDRNRRVNLEAVKGSSPVRSTNAPSYALYEGAYLLVAALLSALPGCSIGPCGRWRGGPGDGCIPAGQRPVAGSAAGSIPTRSVGCCAGPAGGASCAAASGSVGWRRQVRRVVRVSRREVPRAQTRAFPTGTSNRSKVRGVVVGVRRR
jgi:hypothetical protein